MKLLLDANISWRLISKLRSHFEECHHADHIGITVPAKDTAIWKHALQNEMIIVTNDDDFLNLASAKGFPPKVVLLRTGNQSNSFIEELLIKHKSDIEALNHSPDYGFLEIF